MRKKVRMADIAERLDISIVSVSKGLAGKDGVSEEMRGRIFAVAKELGYTLPTNKTEKREISGNVGILVADHFISENAFYPAMYRQVVVHLAENGYSAMMEIVTAEAERQNLTPSMVQAKKVDGIIFLGEMSREYIHSVNKSGLPFILMDFYDDDLGMDCVLGDNLSGSFRLTNTVLESGKKRIAFVGSAQATSSIMDRCLGYIKALLLAGIPIRQDWLLEDRDERGLLIDIQLPEDMPDAFVCNCDEVAYNLIKLLKSKGYRIPEDIAVTGYDDHQFAQISNPPLTTYRVDMENMGRAAASQLIRKIRGKSLPKGNTVVSGMLIRRESV